LSTLSSRRPSANLGAAALIAALAVALPLGAHATPSDPRLRPVRSWALGLGSGNLDGDVDARFAPFDLIVIDGEEATAAQVASLRANGRRLVLAYLSVGTIEPGRPWYSAAKPYRLDRFEEFGEWYADTARKGYRRLIAQAVAPPMLAKGFDGLFLDNTDMIGEHPHQASGMHRLARSLAALVHGRRGLLFTQNGEHVIGPSLASYDGWNREDVSSTYDFGRRRYTPVPSATVRENQHSLRRMAAAGMLVTASDYTAAGDEATTDRAVRKACAAGALPFVTNIEITRIPREPFRCPQPGTARPISRAGEPTPSRRP
jgi:endo-alpha-1,4-polygalactosaminidase (GH114 family)